jgi:phosphate ABC transporter phosphate-binding protein
MSYGESKMSGSGTGTTTGTTGGNTGEQPTIQRKGRGKAPIIAVGAVIVVVLIVALAGWQAGWFKAAASNPCNGVSPGKLSGQGSTLVQPLMNYWASTYWNGAVVSYGGGGSSQGIQAITSKIADFGASDAPLDLAQRQAAGGGVAANNGLLTIPESAGGVVPIYNVAGVGQLNFNGSVLAEIFNGNITNWNNTPLQTLNPKTDLPNVTIEPVHRTGGSGTTFIFTSFLSLESKYWNKTYGKNLTWPSTAVAGIGASGNGGVATTVGTTSNSIGYVDLNYALNSASGVGIGAVQNPKGNFIRATVQNTVSAMADSTITLPTGLGDWYNLSLLNAPGTNDYPITSLTYTLVWQNLSAYSTYTTSQAENLVDFLTWMVTVGQNDSALLYFDPLPGYIVTHDIAEINSMTFGGKSIQVCIPASTA